LKNSDNKPAENHEWRKILKPSTSKKDEEKKYVKERNPEACGDEHSAPSSILCIRRKKERNKKEVICF
jgi:hypothetical protein